MKVPVLVGAAVSAIICSGQAYAAVTVIGDSLAHDCSVAALREQYDAASVEICDRALRESPLNRHDLAATYINRGVMLLRQNRYDLARSDFDRAIALRPELGEGWVNRGAVNIGQKRYQDGLSDLNKGIALGVEEPEKAYFNRALAYEGLDDEKLAYLDYQQASTLKPDWDLPKKELLRFTVTRREAQ